MTDTLVHQRTARRCLVPPSPISSVKSENKQALCCLNMQPRPHRVHSASRATHGTVPSAGMAIPENSWAYWVLLCTLSIAGFAVSIVSCVGARRSKDVQALLGSHRHRHDVSSTEASSKSAEQTVGLCGEVLGEASLKESLSARSPPVLGVSSPLAVQSSKASVSSLAPGRAQEDRVHSPSKLPDLDPGRSSLAMEKLLERFEDLSAKLQQHINRQVSPWI